MVLRRIEGWELGKKNNLNLIKADAPFEDKDYLFYEEAKNVYDGCPGQYIKILLDDLNAMIVREAKC